ncbi:hypothetical protein CBR_g10824 [Chara braunii]|uniref:Uncharacterized protein n=1 Tax=Chara braunii TaxID=69332 RepID=A0A388KPC8_CHABU|nr:hypothetical protein CBR_g10824 [Chara braunii]|eukprot:GBG71887.1 hypothetical protein CBR_g10824 [Chara braunii]
MLTLVLFACYLSGILRFSSEENTPSVARIHSHSVPIDLVEQRMKEAVAQGLKVAAASGCPRLFNSAGHLTSNQHARLNALNASVQSSAGANVCQPELVSYLISTINGPQNERPQLSFDQLMWIAVTVAASGASILNAPSCMEGGGGGGGCSHNFLVWGMGRDSHVWMNANCIPEAAKAGGKIRTRTVFLENYESWFNMIRSKFPTMEGYLIKYKWTLGRAQFFFQNPYIMDVPDTMKDTCFSVVLVDGPQGFKRDHPGRMEAAYWSVSMAKRCLTEMKLDVVNIFLHDVGRSVEKEIMKIFFYPNSQILGFVAGSAGELAGFRFTRSSLQDEGNVQPTE